MNSYNIMIQTFQKNGAPWNKNDSDSKYCTISGLKLTKNEKFLIPRQPENIVNLKIECSLITCLSEDLMGAFPYLESLDASDCKIEEISENAFVGCKNLTDINLNKNHIYTLEKNVFNRNTKLEEIWLNFNKLDSLPKELFHNLENLKSVYINRNNLLSLSEELFTNLKMLRQFNVCGNQIMDLEVEKILKHCPSLKSFGIGDNDFSFAVLQNLQITLTNAGVVDTSACREHLKARPYATQKLNYVEYIPDAEYKKLLEKRKASKIEQKQIAVQKNVKLSQTNLDLEKKVDVMEQQMALMMKKIEAMEKSREEDK